MWLRTTASRGAVSGGTPAYMAPEQIDAWTGGGPAATVDGRADVDSLAQSLFEALTGRPPFPPPARGGETCWTNSMSWSRGVRPVRLSWPTSGPGFRR
jgi:serine/threonine protein kinase